MSIQLFSRGKWVVNAPFAVSADTVYTCTANRSFREMESEGDSVFNLVYQPRGLTQLQCETDRVNSVTIVVLESEGNPSLLIPTSYIQSYPTAVLEGFSRIVLAVEIGLLSDKVPLEYLKANLQQVVADVIGVENAKVELFTAPYRGVITPEQAELIEQNRQALVKSGTNHYSENKRLADQLALANAKVQRLEQIIIANSLVG